MTTLHSTIASVTERIRERSRDSRAAYLAGIAEMAARGRPRGRLDCGNLAHACAASLGDKARIAAGTSATEDGSLTRPRGWSADGDATAGTMTASDPTAR